MLNKLLIISGPTASGKTALALKIAKKYHGELISADSRQIYQGMDIGTGKDRQSDIPVHLIDLITPNQAFSVAQYQRLALIKVKELQQKDILPIVVGGTGLYIDAILNKNSATYHVKPNKVLRFILSRLSLTSLQNIYKCMDHFNSPLSKGEAAKPRGILPFDSLNNSEVHNPHRLIRKIEINLGAMSPFPQRSSDPRRGEKPRSSGERDLAVLHLSLTAPSATLYKRIDQRVKDRLDAGLLDEISNLLKKYSWNNPGLNCLAYKEFRNYFVETRDRASLLTPSISRWRFDEHAYARRQKTWFKKDAQAQKIDITKADFNQKILNTIDIWYNKP